jgi:signal transduction histidine kinase
MLERRSLRWPITLGVTMIVLLVALLVGWVVLSVYGAMADRGTNAPLYWTLLPIGTLFLLLVLVGVVIYLALSVKAINLNRRQSNFTHSVTHELKSPIASLKLYIQTLNSREVSAREQDNFFQFMLEDVERLDHLINHLLEAARLDRKPTNAEFEDVDLDKLLEQCVENARLRHRAPLDAVHVELERSVVRARRVDLEMIFRNLIDNALKYAGDEPRVEIISQVTASGEVRTEVRDNGRGIPRHLRRKIFGRFVRLGMETQRDKPGTGLGLYIVRTLVRQLRGRVRLHDRESGTGTTFEVYLPLLRSAAESHDAPQPNARQNLTTTA